MEQLSRRIPQILAGIGLCLCLAACSSGPETPVYCTEKMTLAPKKATSRPYQINGEWYYPQPHYEYCEEGIASLYGGGDVFHGRPTATGERFNMNGITAAHKTVPLPCMAKVTNLENGRELIVKINDRGPFIDGRIIDLSRRSAQLLGFEHKGLTKVRVETLVSESLALNGIESPTVMLAEAPKSPVKNPPIVPVAAPPSISTTKLAALKDPFEALVDSSIVEKSRPLLVQAEAPLQEPAPLPIVASPVSEKAIASTGIFVYLGEYESYAKAQVASHSLGMLADSPLDIIKNKGPQPYAARLGPLASMSEANQLLDQLLNAGHLIARIVIQR